MRTGYILSLAPSKGSLVWNSAFRRSGGGVYLKPRKRGTPNGGQRHDAPEKGEIIRFWPNPVQFLESSLPKMVGDERELC
jgi:hypothetical protein